MKTVTVATAYRQYTIQLNGVDDGDALTPAIARRAARKAFGYGAHATVSDGVKAYRVTSTTTRKVKP